MRETISLTEYARLHGRRPDSARQMANRGGFRTARKLGRDWVIDRYEPYPDHRRRHERDRTQYEEDAIGNGLRELLTRRFGTAFPVIEGDDPGHGYRDGFDLRIRAAWTEGEAGLTDEEAHVYDIDPDSHHETTVHCDRPYTGQPTVSMAAEAGRDPGEEWLRRVLVPHIPLCTVPTAIRSGDGWITLDDDTVAAMAEVSRGETPKPIRGAE